MLQVTAKSSEVWRGVIVGSSVHTFEYSCHNLNFFVSMVEGFLFSQSSLLWRNLVDIKV
jgi:hypothetical protein